MSYILDALRKSEQQRQRSGVPSLYTAQISTNVESQPSFLLYGAVAAVLICSGVLIGWFRPWHHDVIITVSKPVPPKPSESKPALAVAIPTPEPVPVRNPEPLPSIQKPALTIAAMPEPATRMKLDVPKPVKAEDRPLKPQPKAASKPLPEAAPVQKAEPVQIVSKPTVQAAEKSIPHVAEAVSDSGASENAQEPKIVAVSELPLAIQQELPKMTISGYAYSNTAKERTVGINDRLLQEGEYLAQGLRLERISPDGLVFSYKKYLFRLSL